MYRNWVLKAPLLEFCVVRAYLSSSFSLVQVEINDEYTHVFNSWFSTSFSRSQINLLPEMRWLKYFHLRKKKNKLPLVFVSAEKSLKSWRALVKWDASNLKPWLNSWIWLATILSDDSIVPILFLKLEFSFFSFSFAAANCSFFSVGFLIWWWQKSVTYSMLVTRDIINHNTYEKLSMHLVGKGSWKDR